MRPSSLLRASLLALVAWWPAHVLAAPAGTDEAAVRAADARYWRTFDECDLDAMAGLVDADIEFYHDITGLTLGREAVVASFRRGPCADREHLQLRRLAQDGEVRFHPLAGGYAVLEGTHRFEVRRPGQTPRVETEAAFVSLWHFADGQWRLHRVISYGHAPAG